LVDVAPDDGDLADTYEVGRNELKRFLFALDEQSILRQVEKSGQILNEDEKRQFIEYARHN
jgi:hypothetical protein